MFVHHVYFWMSPDATPADRARLVEGIRSLQAIETIQFSHIGIPASTHRDVIERGYAYSWLAHFETAEAEAIYQSHPAHLRFVEECKHLWTKVVVFDSVDAP